MDTPMIVDGHAYCFPPLAAANGFPTADAHRRYVQREMADHHQPTWRLDDHAMVDEGTLAEPADLTLRGLRDVGFRADGYGRFVWEVDGRRYAKQYLPPTLVDLSHPPDLMVAQMDNVGVQRAVLHASPVMGYLNDYLARCVRAHPDRLLGLASVPEWQIETGPDAAIAAVRDAYASGLHGFQFVANARVRHGVTAPWHGPASRPFWDAVVLGKPIFFTLGPPCPGTGLDDYLDELRRWRAWLERYPDAAAVLTHGFPWRMFRERDGLRLPDAVFEPFRASAARLELLFPIALGSVWDYPRRELHPTIARLVEVVGTSRLIWGTDMPNVERFCTYRQTLDAFRIHCRGVLTEEDLANILGRTLATLFGL
jgi:predicted TIM-barrel fold metal-dependent hydrolase